MVETELVLINDDNKKIITIIIMITSTNNPYDIISPVFQAVTESFRRESLNKDKGLIIKFINNNYINYNYNYKLTNQEGLKK